MERVLQRSDYHRRPHFDNVHFRHNPRRRDKSPRWLLHLWTGHRATGSQSVTDSLHNNDRLQEKTPSEGSSEGTYKTETS